MFLVEVKLSVKISFDRLICCLRTKVWGDFTVEESESGQILFVSQQHIGSKKLKVNKMLHSEHGYTLITNFMH